MAKPVEKARARSLRQEGMSLKAIARKLKVSPGSVHRWCRDITLTPEQEEQINARASVPQMRALRKANKRKQTERIERHRVQELDGAKQLGKLTKRDLLVLGLGLYWGEGSKRSPGDVSLANMDPQPSRGLFEVVAPSGSSGPRAYRVVAHRPWLRPRKTPPLVEKTFGAKESQSRAQLRGDTEVKQTPHPTEGIPRYFDDQTWQHRSVVSD